MASNKVIPSYFKVDKLVNDIIECITSLSQEFSCMSIPIDDSCTPFHRFCAKLEQFLYLGLKDKSLFGKRRSYWDYILRSLVSNKGGIHEGLKFVKNNTELKTSVGRGRAFLRFCLVHQCLADTLQQCVLGAGDMSKEWYEEWAPMRNEDAVKQLIASLYDLNPVQFDLSSPSCHDLDQSWPTFNRKEFGSPYNWRAISRSGSISSLTNSLSNIDPFGNPRALGTMGSVQEGPERNGDLGDEGAQALREVSEEKEEWWMSEDQGILVDGAQSTPADISGSWKRGEDGLRKMEEEWEEKERVWNEERQRLKEEYEAQLELHRSTEEELKIETDMLKARVLELEVVNTMAKWESVGVQATSEDDNEKCERAELEEKLVSICKENEQLKKDLEQMKIFSKGDQQKRVTCVFCSKEMDVQALGIYGVKPQQSSKHEDDLRREYESQIRNIRELRNLYEERMKAAEDQSKKLRENLQEKSRRLELSRKRCSELRAHSQELEALLGEQESVARGLQTRLSASLEEGRALASQLATVNKLFGRLGDTAELDFERLRLLQYSCDKDGDTADCANTLAKVAGGEEVSELKAIAASLPKVWRLLVELLGEEQKEEEKVGEGAKDTSEDCFNSVPTPYGPRLVISVSRTFIKLKDLILEKKSLQNELGKIRDLNGRLESKLKQQERRLATVKVELKRTWGLVARMRAQHEQLHSSEQVLRYELQQKRKLLGELKKELEYCREKWELARLKNSQSEKEWKLLREEFRARRSTNVTVESTEANSPESGFSDGRGEDEEEDENAAAEYFKSSKEDVSEQEDKKLVDSQLDECCAAEASISNSLNEISCREGEASSVDVVDSHDKSELESDKGPKSQEKVEGSEEKLVHISDKHSSATIVGEVCSPVETPVCDDEACSMKEAKDTTGSVIISPKAGNLSKESPCASSDGACSSKNSEGTSTVKDSASGSSTPLGSVGGVAPQQGELSVEERLQARAERLRRLEEQCNLLFRKVTRTTTRSAQLSSRLEELHEQYGDQQSSSRGRSRTESPAAVDTGTRVRPPTPALMVEHPPTPPPLPSSLPSVRLPTLLHHLTPVTEASGPSLMSTDVLLAETSEGDHSEIQRIPSPEESLENQELEDGLEGEEYLALSIGDSSVDLGNLLPRLQTTASSSSLASNLSEDPSEENDSQEMEELGLSMEESSNCGGEATESSMTEETVDSYMAEMSSAIYGLHHGPLFDEGNPLLDEEEYGGVAEEEEEDTNEEVSAVNSGSIGVASLLLQQLPKRIDILRRERHSLEQRLEEGEAALMRALAGTAEAERRARVLERGLEQAQERLRVLEMEAAVERNERLLEIKAALVDNRSSERSSTSSLQASAQNEQSKTLEEEVNNLQQQTLAQIAGLQAAAVVSRNQKEQLDKLTNEVERQEKIVGYMERELASLKQERGELMDTLEETRSHLKDTTTLLEQKEEENISLKAEVEKLKKESDESNKENLALFSRLAAAEAEVTRLNAEVEQLKEDSDHLREAVIRLTGEKETLYRANHNLEEMKRIVLEDSRWVADKESEQCTACGVSFSLIIRRHHCRNCGRIFCGACSSHWLALHSAPQSTSLVAGVVESIMSVAGGGKRYRACADCFAAHCADTDGDLPGPSQPRKTDEYKSPENEAGSSEAAGDSGEGAEDGDEDEEDFSMISEEEVSFSQCTPYVPNPRTLQYWKSCEIQCGVTLSAKDLLDATVPDSNEPGNGKGEVIWVRAGSIYSVPLLIDDTHVSIYWEFSTDPNSIAFSVLYKTAADIPMSCALIVVPTRRVDSHLKPVRGRLRPKNSGVYVLMFDNSFSRFTGKKITYSLRAEVSSGRESVASSCRSSAEPFPDLPTNQDGDVTERGDDGELVNEDDSRAEASTEK